MQDGNLTSYTTITFSSRVPLHDVSSNIPYIQTETNFQRTKLILMLCESSTLTSWKIQDARINTTDNVHVTLTLRSVLATIVVVEKQ